MIHSTGIHMLVACYECSDMINSFQPLRLAENTEGAAGGQLDTALGLGAISGGGGCFLPKLLSTGSVEETSLLSVCIDICIG